MKIEQDVILQNKWFFYNGTILIHNVARTGCPITRLIVVNENVDIKFIAHIWNNLHQKCSKDKTGHDNRMLFLTGPFTSNEMAEWFSAGYFTMNLQVKRGCDEKISPLGLYLLFMRLS